MPCPPSLESGPPRANAACVAATQRPHRLTPPGPHFFPRIACPPFDSAVGVGVQPADQLRHVQGHEYGLHVRSRALRACPAPPHPALSRALPPRANAACVAATRLSTRQYGVFNQPLSFDTSKVTVMLGMFAVRSARALAPHSLESGPPPVQVPLASPPPCTPNALTPPGPYLFPHLMPAFRLGRARLRSTSRSTSTRPRSRTCRPCFKCAPRVPCPPPQP